MLLFLLLGLDDLLRGDRGLKGRRGDAGEIDPHRVADAMLAGHG